MRQRRQSFGAEAGIAEVVWLRTYTTHGPRGSYLMNAGDEEDMVFNSPAEARVPSTRAAGAESGTKPTALSEECTPEE